MPSRIFALAVLVTSTILVADDFPYQQPPKIIIEALNALPAPAISVSPQRDYAVFMQQLRYPSIAEVAQPMLRLAGIRIDTNTNAMHMAPTYTSYALQRLSDGGEVKVGLPRDSKLGVPIWSPDGKQFAFTNTMKNGVELWMATTATGQARRIEGAVVNGVMAPEPVGAEWMGDNKTLIVRLVPAGRGAPPAETSIPKGPHVQESLGHAGPAPTYEDLLSTPHDEDLFDYYATAQLAWIDAETGKLTPLGSPGIFTALRPSPDDKHLMVSRLHRPYSYQLPANAFPAEVEVWDRAAKVEYKIASLPLADRVPLAGVRTGPRNYIWLPAISATLTWVEALDGGNPKEKALNRDRIMEQTAPFLQQPQEVARVKERFRGMQPLADGKALVEDYERVSRVIRTLELDLDKPGSDARVIFSRNERDAYRDPGTPVTKMTPDGRRTAVQTGDQILLTGLGASPSGDKPFVDRFNLATGKSERVFQSEGGFGGGRGGAGR